MKNDTQRGRLAGNLTLKTSDRPPASYKAVKDGTARLSHLTDLLSCRVNVGHTHSLNMSCPFIRNAQGEP